MVTTTLEIEIDEELKENLQELLSEVGMDITTFFAMGAKQAVREQALPFCPSMNTEIYGLKAYQLAMKNTKYDDKGKAVISSNDESVTETEWDDMFTQMKKKIR